MPMYNVKVILLLTCIKSIAVDRLGSGIPVSACFQIIALTAGRKCPGEEGNCLGEMSGIIMSCTQCNGASS